MIFKYISLTPQAPEKSTIFGYLFIKDGDGVEVKEPEICAKLLKMAHVGIVKDGESEEMGKGDVVEETLEDKATALVKSKKYLDLKSFVAKNEIPVVDQTRDCLEEAAIKYLINNELNKGADQG